MAASGLSERIAFKDIDWSLVPAETGVYVIHDAGEVLYVGMSGRNGKGNLRSRLKDHASGQMVNMFSLYLFLNRVQFDHEPRITHPAAAKAANRAYIVERCSLQFMVLPDGKAARAEEDRLKVELRPTLNG